MTKQLGILVLIACAQCTLLAGPVENIELNSAHQPNSSTAPLDRGLTSYAAFMELAGPLWALNIPGATFDSAWHYATESARPAPVLDPLSEDSVLVPEPRSATLLALGLTALALLSLRRRRRTHLPN